METSTDRRTALQSLGVALTVGAGFLANRSHAAQGQGDGAFSQAATTLAEFTKRLAAAPRRRSFKTVPMILDNRQQWDHEALTEVLTYRPATKQVWDNTDIGGSWLNSMRNGLNAEVWSFGHAGFLAVSATHGPAQMALYDQQIWDKYGLAKLAGRAFATNTLIEEQAAGKADAGNYQDPQGVYSAANTSIPALQRRGAVFMACHNAAWELAARLIAVDANPDRLSIEALVADLTNHLIPGVILTPGTVGTLAELHRAGYAYVR